MSVMVIRADHIQLKELDLYKVIRDLQTRVDQLEGKYPVAQEVKVAEIVEDTKMKVEPSAPPTPPSS